jgi:zinc/manganese transport system substrate-binding protein
MRTATGIILSAFLTFIAMQPARAAEGKLAVVAAENFYGDIARQIDGDRIDVTSIMSNPDHLLQQPISSPSV